MSHYANERLILLQHMPRMQITRPCPWYIAAMLRPPWGNIAITFLKDTRLDCTCTAVQQCHNPTWSIVLVRTIVRHDVCFVSARYSPTWRAFRARAGWRCVWARLSWTLQGFAARWRAHYGCCEDDKSKTCVPAWAHESYLAINS